MMAARDAISTPRIRYLVAKACRNEYAQTATPQLAPTALMARARPSFDQGFDLNEKISSVMRGCARTTDSAARLSRIIRGLFVFAWQAGIVKVSLSSHAHLAIRSSCGRQPVCHKNRITDCMLRHGAALTISAYCCFVTQLVRGVCGGFLSRGRLANRSFLAQCAKRFQDRAAACFVFTDLAEYLDNQGVIAEGVTWSHRRCPHFSINGVRNAAYHLVVASDKSWAVKNCDTMSPTVRLGAMLRILKSMVYFRRWLGLHVKQALVYWARSDSNRQPSPCRGDVLAG